MNGFADTRNARIVESLDAYARSIGVSFRDPGLLLEALTHRSYVNERAAVAGPDNQRLEYLGDAVLDLLVGEWLYHRFPHLKEGDLTNARAHIVRTEALAMLARDIALGEHLLLGRGELGTGGSEREANLCAAFEALVGAVYLDGGLEQACAWVKSLLRPHAQDIDAAINSKDAKSRLQEAVQAALHETPYYRVVDETGPDHAKVFTSEVVVGDQVWGKGRGTTKQAAEQVAASAALIAHANVLGASLSAGGDLA